MAYIFGDGFDCYSVTADAILGYWDSQVAGIALQTGRFTGSQCLQFTSSSQNFTKSSGVNDAVHHFVCAVRQSAALSGTNPSLCFQLIDGATNQCCVVFRQDGALLLTSGGPVGTTLATYTGAISAQNTWFAFEIEVVINNTTGSFTVRKNGNTSNDFTLGSLNTRGGTANNYANKITVGTTSSGAANAQQLDDFLWRSDASSVPWVGDIRCYTRLPASDASVQFSRSSPTAVLAVATTGTAALSNTNSRYGLVTAPFDGTISSVVLSLNAGFTGNMKCAFFSAAGAVIQSATAILNNPATGNNTFNFSPGLVLTRGTSYYFGFISDVNSGTYNVGAGTTGATFVTTYAAFPSAATFVTQNGAAISATLTASDNCSFVNEAQQDGATSYVYDSNVGDADLYNIAALSGTPASTIAVTTRGFVEKSDAGTRAAAVQLKSGATTVQSTSTALSTSWGWLWRTDTTDPATGAAWTATAVNNAQIGPVVTV